MHSLSQSIVPTNPDVWEACGVGSGSAACVVGGSEVGGGMVITTQEAPVTRERMESWSVKELM